jgi:hypothetical protein
MTERGQGGTATPKCAYAPNGARRRPECHDVVREDMRRTL